MNKFVRNLLTEWRKLKLAFEGETFVVAVSGGGDSTALLAALHELNAAKKIKSKFVVAHFNHRLRAAESDADADFVAVLTKNYAFDFVLRNAENLSETNDNLEQAARRERYEFLQQTAEKYDAAAVLTAHTLNDQAETFLLNLLRGSGAIGLGAMKPVRKINDGSEILLVRPLLNWAKRADTGKFAHSMKIKFRFDAMNEDEKFARVRIRKKLIPYLSEFNPKIIETLAQTAALLQKDAAEIEEAIETSSFKLDGEISVGELKKISDARRGLVIRKWLAEARGDLRGIDFKHLTAVENLIFSRKSGRKVELPDGGSVIKRDGKLFFEKTAVEKSCFGN